MIGSSLFSYFHDFVVCGVRKAVFQRRSLRLWENGHVVHDSNVVPDHRRGVFVLQRDV